MRRSRLTPARGATNPLGSYPNLKRLFEEVEARPAAKRTRDVGKEHPFKTERDEEALRALFPSNYPDA